ncbi:hypothetical protein ONA92_26450 [Mycobacteroides salmoniphilum]|uniref:hypothetical protein n=1 Tax=Mycobacteroides salmoniphilum TaxID=404941 RepID=UPI0035685906
MKNLVIALVLLVVVVPVLAAAAAALGLYYLIASIPQWLLVAVVVYLLIVIRRLKGREKDNEKARRDVAAMVADLQQREALATQARVMRGLIADQLAAAPHPTEPRQISAPERWSWQ